MSIQSRWRVNTYSGHKATNLPNPELQLVLDLIGIEITSTPSSQHYVTGTVAEFSTDSTEKILSGDEVIKVNDQIVVGWSRKNLVAKLQENPNGVSLLLRRLPTLSVKHKDKPTQQKEEKEEDGKRLSEFERAPTSVRSYSFRAAVSPELKGPEELPFDGLDGSTQTALSRRRVSCRELGLPDCDGWLWKKRKETSVFMTQKWQRFWFVLKGVTIYWYTSQQEEKAVGMVKIGSYSIESAGEHKRKYVFKMCHPRFQNFFFAADNVSDMSKGRLTFAAPCKEENPHGEDKKVEKKKTVKKESTEGKEIIEKEGRKIKKERRKMENERRKKEREERKKRK
ncbi:Connector enhancer of kinase suppressor of ras 1 [Bagarius yarrelli]|uniref:Connector enhancer of kinase suppressor of ras 1 n=1 Tax=Bagarius yarrelli TaxID=175774 RepID=A0A556V4G3_BAGYA|nr:Connector enhancer of kinase suppressor of ras 1 [Bagarius yarrelli]